MTATWGAGGPRPGGGCVAIDEIQHQFVFHNLKWLDGGQVPAGVGYVGKRA